MTRGMVVLVVSVKSSLAVKYMLTVVFDYIPFPVFTHTTGMTHFLDSFLYFYTFH